MSTNSKIEWCDHTFNPWIGCKAISPGCDNCYAAAWAKRYGRDFNTPTLTSGPTWRQALRWNASHEAFFKQHGRRQRVFCASLADVFDNSVDPYWRTALFDLIKATPNLDWLLLTKRIGNVHGMLAELAHGSDPDLSLLDMMPLPNVWIGATIVNREEMLRDGPKLKQVPAQVHFWSCEPLLSDLGEIPGELMPHWIIAGGESGPGARPMHPDWARSLRDQCQATGVPFLFKQWGAWRAPTEAEEYDTTMGMAQRVPSFIVSRQDGTVHCFEGEQTRDGGQVMLRVGKKAAGRSLDGREWNGAPA